MTTDKTKRFFRVSAEDFKKIPGSPIAYWASNKTTKIFSQKNFSDWLDIRAGVLSGNDNLFVRNWFEIAFQDIPLTYTSFTEIKKYNPNWLPITGGGGYRKWYGALFSVIRSQNDFAAIKKKPNNNYRLREPVFYFQKGLNWPLISSQDFCAKLSPAHILFGNSVRSGFLFSEKQNEIEYFIGLLCSKIVRHILNFINPTVNSNNEDIARIPVCISLEKDSILKNSSNNISISKSDWDSYETSWDFQENPLWKERQKGHWVSVVPICQYYQDLRRHWAEQTEEMQTLERCNNNIFIQAYGLQDELSAEVPWDEITLTCNPWYRYGKRPQPESSQETLYQSFECLPDGVKLNQPVSSQSGYCGFPYSQALEERLLADTMKEFISYAVGCMMGRYSLEKPGLILANQGEDFDDYIAKVRAGTEKQNEQETVRSGFLPDRDGVLPILDDEWFVDDIVAQFKDFLKFTFGEEAFSRNLAFIEKAIGKDIRKYFMKDFYKEHVQRYKKRPIYWLFSSPKGSFNALIYLHRYRPDTVSIVLNDYLREFMTKLRVQRSHLIDDNNRADLSASEKSANLKRIDKYAAMLAELEDYERDILFPLAQKQLAIDLDDGVKVNYLKFGAALKEIPGLKAREE